MRIEHVTVEERPALHRRRHPVVNQALLVLLRSPLHHLLDSELCELSYRAPRSGRIVDLPVMYATDGTGLGLVVLVGDAPEKTWWRAFREPGPVRVRRGGTVRHGTARVLAPADPRYTAAIDVYERRHGIRPVDGDRVVLIENLTPMETDI